MAESFRGLKESRTCGCMWAGLGKGWKIPVTLKLYRLSMRMTLLMGSASPKYLRATSGVRRMEKGSVNAVCGLPLRRETSKIEKKLLSAKKRSFSLKTFSSYRIEALLVGRRRVIFWMSGKSFLSRGPKGGATAPRWRETIPSLLLKLRVTRQILSALLLYLS